VIGSLLFTIFIEGLVVLGYSAWRKKPAGRLLLVSILANLLTQSLLGLALNLFWEHYLTALLTAEIFIWLIEGLIFYRWPGSRLTRTEAVLLSLGMNLASFGLGWSLPV
jgi:membrane-associated PAP2 superfamily phosphatase